MIAAEGILTAKGGVSSHAALVARQMGKVCVCGASGVEVDYHKKTVKAGGKTFKEGDYLSIDGTAGTVYGGELATEESEIITGLVNGKKASQETEKFKNFVQLMDWCAKATKMGVRTNADSPEQVKTAIAFGAEGIGLTRTEHMFFEGERIDAMREMILASDEKSRKAALKKLLPHQRKDFFGIFKALEGKPATIRLLDPPLHEFLPHTEEQQKDLAAKMGVTFEELHQRVEELHESNPMLGHRGCRLAISYPEIAEMQAQAIFEAAAQCVAKGIPVKPEVMVPLVGYARELELQVEIVHRVAAEVKEKKGVKFNYLVGTMIEVPRGSLTADEIAKHAEFFSFGTNDLTQTALGVSRDDMGSFLPLPGNRCMRKTHSLARYHWRRTAHGNRRRARSQDQARTSRSVSAVSTVAIRPPSRSATARSRLRFLLALPRASRPPRRRGSDQRRLRSKSIRKESQKLPKRPRKVSA